MSQPINLSIKDSKFSSYYGVILISNFLFSNEFSVVMVLF